MLDFHTPSIFIANQVKLLCKHTLCLVRKYKKEYYLKMLQEANSHNIWTYRKWTQNKRSYRSPPLNRSDSSEPAIDHEDKCKILWEHLFPEPSILPDKPEINDNPRDLDLMYFSVMRREVRDTIFTAAQLNTPGISGLTGRAWRWAWGAMEEQIFQLIRLCTDLGYHPKTWRTALTVAIQKPNRDYANPRSYRLVQLLEVLGKMLERIQARRLFVRERLQVRCVL